ncbi:TVG0957188 [Thermoplasma volcanium GSS1]|uniref:TVG0957188 protein n=1 Tax=Thermoplasma volcanium (strain ATCC 51530 / DSM 4299 / JCM 9571 / NBRC 15438 / GSS1) TaxID=273116 RepID=Q97A81_THEVO|nr:TVG0957188 [Thermoplasma volcanium GSS1]
MSIFLKERWYQKIKTGCYVICSTLSINQRLLCFCLRNSLILQIIIQPLLFTLSNFSYNRCQFTATRLFSCFIQWINNLSSCSIISDLRVSYEQIKLEDTNIYSPFFLRCYSLLIVFSIRIIRNIFLEKINYWAIASTLNLEVLGPNSARSKTTIAMNTHISPKDASSPCGRKKAVINGTSIDVDILLTLYTVPAAVGLTLVGKISAW